MSLLSGRVARNNSREKVNMDTTTTKRFDEIDAGDVLVWISGRHLRVLRTSAFKGIDHRPTVRLYVVDTETGEPFEPQDRPTGKIRVLVA